MGYNKDDFDSEIQILTERLTYFSRLGKNVSQKNIWLNNAKKQLYIYYSINKSEGLEKYKKNSDLDSLDNIIKNLKANLPLQVRLFEATAKHLKLIFQKAMEYPYRLSNDEAKYIKENIEDPLQEIIKNISSLIEIYKNESSIMKNKDPDINKMIALFNEERAIYRKIRIDKMMNAPQEFGKFVKQNTREGMLLKTTTLVFIILLILAIIIPFPDNSTNETILASMGAGELILGFRHSKSKDILYQDFDKEFNNIVNINNILEETFADVVSITAEWQQLKQFKNVNVD